LMYIEKSRPDDAGNDDEHTESFDTSTNNTDPMAYGEFKGGQVLAIDVHLFRQNPWSVDISSMCSGASLIFDKDNGSPLPRRE